MWNRGKTSYNTKIRYYFEPKKLRFIFITSSAAFSSDIATQYTFCVSIFVLFAFITFFPPQIATQAKRPPNSHPSKYAAICPSTPMHLAQISAFTIAYSAYSVGTHSHFGHFRDACDAEKGKGPSLFRCRRSLFSPARSHAPRA